MKSVRSEKTCSVYITVANRTEARRIALALVSEKLAACVNVLGAIESIYEWKGRIQNAREVALLAKTTRSKLTKLTVRVKELHFYDTPCIVALPIEGGNKAFIDWIAASVEE